MRKLAVLLFCLFISTALWANPFALYADGENWIPEQVYVALGNDMWAFGGFTYNMDDQLSYSQEILIEAPVWWLDIFTAGITNRGWQNGWDIHNKEALGDGNRIQGRYDKAFINLYLPFHVLDTDLMWIWAAPIIGVAAHGNIGLDDLQNGTHKLAKKPLLHIPYEIENVITDFVLGIECEVGFSFMEFDRSWFFASTRANYQNTFGFGEQLSIFSVIGVTDYHEDIITFNFGYRWNKAETGWLTQELYYNYLKGFYLGLSVNTGAFILDYAGSLSSDYGFGSLGLNVMSLFKKSEWMENDIKFSIGIIKQMKTTFYTTEIAVPIKESRFEPYLSNRFISGDPSFPNWEVGIDVNKTPRYKRSYSSVFFGCRYKFRDYDKNPFVYPYVKVGLGFMSWEKRTILNMVTHDESTGEVNRLHSIVSPKKFSFAGEAEVGLTIFPEGLIKSQHTSFQINLFAGLTTIHNYKEVSSYLDELTDDSDKIATLMPRWGFTLVMGFDI